ncbi:mammalian cell entry protein [Mycobacterium liflandii]|uniref:MCE family protein n=1 Tax=Mycobacterium ulcerans TaxID=1809 RepID=UPI001F06DD6D|nr:MlaD family protein [Mycobacterium ulcerans]ULL08945.1 mammalian cell entry protein [Mycobacterium liflandii]
MTSPRTRTRRGALLWVAFFLVVATALTWMVYVTLRHDVKGPTARYGALFTDVFGLREGDDVRVAGVRVGRVQKVELDQTLARVSFIVQQGQPILTDTIASITYQNIVGQRYLALAPGRTGRGIPIPPGSVIPVERTEPSFDIGTLLNGYEPLFAVLDPDQVNNFTKAVIASLQGDTSALATLVNQTSTLTATFAGNDDALANVIGSLDRVAGSLASQSAEFEHTIAQTRQMVSQFNSRRSELVESTGNMAAVVRQLGGILADVNPQIRQILDRQPGYTKHLLDIEPQAAFVGMNTPLLLKGLARVFGQGTYMNVYGCDVNFYGYFPGLNDMVPIIVAAATPGGKPMYTPKCRNVTDG